MKGDTVIFYLSCTGNTRWVAESLAAMFGDRAVDIAGAFEDDYTWHLSPGELLGFCFPVHGWRPPKFFLDFMERLTVDNAAELHPYTFAVCTVGDTVGMALDMFRDVCAKKGYPLDFMCDVLMPNTYVGLPFMDVDDADKTQWKLKEADHRMEELYKYISSRREGSCIMNRGEWPRTNTEFLGGLFVRHLLTDKPFRVDRRLCNKCGKCLRVCPVRNIRRGDDGCPEWERTKKCLSCFACYHNCPNRAIRYGWMTASKGQYHLPEGKELFARVDKP